MSPSKSMRVSQLLEDAEPEGVVEPHGARRARRLPGGSASALEVIVDVVAGVMGQPREDLFVIGHRDQRFIWPRQVALYCARMMTTHSAPALARYFGLRDHTTVLYAELTVPKKVRRRPDEPADAAERAADLERVEALLRARLPGASDAATAVAQHLMRPRRAVA